MLAGEFTIVNKYLLKDLVEKGVWTPEVRNQIIADRGSVQGEYIMFYVCINVCEYVFAYVQVDVNWYVCM